MAQADRQQRQGRLPQCDPHHDHQCGRGGRRQECHRLRPGKRDGEDVEAIKRLFTPEFRNRLDAIIPSAGLTPEVIDRVVEKFVLQLEASWKTATSRSRCPSRPATGWPSAA
jgi:ATP-dependent Clp protease ATP-binding subunit ClpA